MNTRLMSLNKFLFAALIGFTLIGLSREAAATTAQELDRTSMEALNHLYKSNPVSENLAKEAKAILVFPNIVKAGFVFGGSYGEGVLIKKSKIVDYYNSVSASWGWQVGVQSYGYVVFLMSKKALDYLEKTKGWEFGVGPTVTVVDAGVAKNLTTSTLREDAYAFVFDQKGLMVSLSIEGTKISRIKR